MISSLYKKHSITFFYLMLLLVFSHSFISAQTPDMPFNIYLKQASLKEFTAKIEQLSEYSFIYGEEVVLKHPITLDLKETPLTTILQTAFIKQDISFEITKHHIILKKTTSLPIKQHFTLNGYVLDEISKETLIGANIYDQQNKQGTITNPFGFFSITLPEGNTELNFSYIGYGSKQIALYLCKDTLLTVQLKNDNTLEEIVVLSDKMETGFQSSRMGANNIPLTHIKNTPALLSEADVLKSIQLLPGIQGGITGTSGLYVRGGSPDQNLYLLDGVPLYNVDHTLGILSIFTPESVKKVDLYKSSFPARYGGRLSSVVDIHTKDGNMKEYHGSAMLGLTSGSLNLEGPLVKDRTSFNFALRRSWIDALSAPTIAIWNATRNKGETQIVARYAFTDMNFKLNHQFNDRSRGYAGLYWGNDFLKGGEKREGDNGYESRNTGRLRWGNIMAFTGWSYVFNNQLFGNVNAAFTHYSSTLKGDYYQGTEANYVSQESSTQNRIDDLSIRANFDFRPNASHQLHFGTHYIYHRFHPVDEKSYFSNGMTTQTRQNNDTALPAHELGIYMEEDWKMNKRIRLNAGVHLGLYTIDGKTYTSLEPRFSSRFLINPQLSLKASYTRMSQYVHQVNESYINLPTDTWIPVSRKLKPMQSDQLAVGAYYTTGNKIYSFSIEGYYKWMKHLMDYKDNYQFLPPSTSWEDKLTQGKGRSYGVELIVRKEKGKITGWAGYTLSWNDRQFTEINKGKRFPAKFDNRHKFNIIANWKIKPKLELTGSWTYATGNRLTVSFENYQAVSPQHPFPGGSLVPPYIDSGGLDYYTERNNFQLPAYHRLDLGINIYRPKKKNRMGIWNISIYNVYSYMAPVSIRKGWWYNNDCFYTLGIVPIIPSVSYTYKF